MKILLASTAAYQDNFTGVNKISRLIMELLAKSGHQCHALALKNDLNSLPVEGETPLPVATTPISRERINDVDVYSVDIAHSGQLPVLREAFESNIQTIQPDWIFVSSEDWGQFLLETAVTNAPETVVYLANTPAALPFGPDSIMPNPAGTKLMKKVSVVIAPSQFLADYITQWSGIKAYSIDPSAYGDGPIPSHQANDGSESAAAHEVAHQYISQYETLLLKLQDKVSAKAESKEKEILLRIDNLSDDRRALMNLLKQQQEEKQFDIIERQEREPTGSPLSLAQQRLWVIEQITPDSTLYTIPFVARLEGTIDHAALQQTLDALVVRHEALRTHIVLVDGKPKQRILDPTPVPIQFHDLSASPPDSRPALAHHLVTDAVQTPFVLQAHDLFRAVLIRLSNQCHHLVVTMHHIVSDDWSWGIFVREFALLYRQFTQAIPANLPPLPIQYADFALWQRSRLQQAALAKQLSYWQSQLLDAPTLLDLPTDRPRASMPTLAGDIVSLQVNKALADRLRLFSQSHSTSLFMTMLAGFAALMSRFSHQDDLVLGTPVAGRSRAELAGVFGFFVNTLALRIRQFSQITGEALLHQVRDTVLDAFANQDVPFDQVVEMVAPERTLSHTPLVQVVFTLQTEALQQHQDAQMTLIPEAVSTGTAKFDLTVTAVEEVDGRLSLFAEFRTDLFCHATIKRLLQHFVILLDQFSRHPSQPVHQLPLLSPAEQQLLLHEWNGTKRPFPQTDLVSLVLQQAAQHPHAIALIEGKTCIDYQTLAAHASQLAHGLRAHGVRRGDRVGVHLERGATLVELLMGTLMAGAAYVPLDITYPANRLKLMANDAQLSLVVSQTTDIDWADEALPILTLDALQQQSYPTSPPPCSASPLDLAYIMYTSGSTGIPKGVAVPHQAIVRLVFANQYTKFDADRVFLLLAPVSFDASTFELWGALLHGAICVIYPERVLDPKDLQRLIEAHHVTTLWLTASLFNLIIDENASILSQVKEVLTGGEALSPQHIKRAQQLLPHTQFINGYGPTETTTFACCHRIPQLPNTLPSSIAVGTPIGNTTTYILDADLQPVPIGVPGELYIGGAGLAWGYWGQPVRTASRFVPNPFGTPPGERLYRTGDLVCWNVDGQIEFLGRIDHQVKLRGFRIELGEIETAVMRHPSVRDAAVIVREDTPGDLCLVAYVVAVPNLSISLHELREFLKRDLPAYMVPSIIIPLTSFPLLSNGKLDRENLPIPTEVFTQTREHQFIAPQTPIEKNIAEIWAALLNVEHVSINDNFFEVGGHSLKATHLLTQIEEVFGIKLSMRALFDNPTIAGLTLGVTEQLVDEEDIDELVELLDLFESE